MVFKGILFLLVSFCLIVNPCRAGEPMAAGSVLKQDSYVFTLEEANKLRIRMEELEIKEKKLDEYLALDEVLKAQIKTYQENEALFEKEKVEYQKIIDLQDQSLKRYERKEKWDRVENVAILIGGMLLTTSAFIVTDKVNDYMVYNNPSTSTSALSVKF